jgi:hypothetical protein
VNGGWKTWRGAAEKRILSSVQYFLRCGMSDGAHSD